MVTAAASGCANGDNRVVTVVAENFYAAVRAGDGAGACHLLAPRTRSELEESAGKACDTAVLEEDIPEVDDVAASTVYGSMAQVRSGADTAFLAWFPFGWRVMAVSCSPVLNHPYECKVSG
jgi:hypothetical protein